MIDLTISIITARNRALVLDCLKSIYETVYGLSFEVYLVVNDPESDVAEAVKESFPGVKLIVNPEKRGFAFCNNMVMKMSDARYTLVLNDDTVVLNAAIREMVEFMDATPGAGIIGCEILNPDGSHQWSCGNTLTHRFEYFKAGVLISLLPFLKTPNQESTSEVSWVTGACLMARMSAAREVGLFDENFLFYYEDADWCYRMIKGGWKVLFYPHASIIHHLSQTRNKKPNRDVLTIHRSRLYFFSKHYGTTVVLAVRALTLIESALKYSKAFFSREQGGNGAGTKKALLGGYRQIMKLALTPSPSVAMRGRGGESRPGRSQGRDTTA